jgi:hypothetical protein
MPRKYPRAQLEALRTPEEMETAIVKDSLQALIEKIPGPRGKGKMYAFTDQIITTLQQYDKPVTNKVELAQLVEQLGMTLNNIVDHDEELESFLVALETIMGMAWCARWALAAALASKRFHPAFIEFCRDQARCFQRRSGELTSWLQHPDVERKLNQLVARGHILLDR